MVAALEDDDGRGRAAGPGTGGPVEAVVDVVVDAANVVGSRPDGWWRDRPAAARRLLAQLSALAATSSVAGPGGAPLEVAGVHAVLEGTARAAGAEGLLDGVHVHHAPADGDTSIARLAAELHGAGSTVLVVTADRGLRARLPAAAACAGPGWLRGLLDQLGARDPGGAGGGGSPEE
ncbi:hypothetical protein [Quadrisphaera sp. KR29]|uniref:hypothetical protein n=1 Tax=Quadrisphaera sp. KR29 TaxID=3461391 RepID=UPI004043D1F3